MPPGTGVCGPEVCRVCLVTELRMLPIGEALQPVYEKLAGVALGATGRPVVACYICHGLLLKARQLMTKAVTAETVLRVILEVQPEVTAKSLSALDRTATGLATNLAVSKPEYTDNIVPQTTVLVKVERVDSDVDNSDAHLEDGASLENTETQTTNKQDTSSQKQDHTPPTRLDSVNTLSDTRTASVKETVPPEKHHECHICERVFPLKDDLEDHLKSHMGEKTHIGEKPNMGDKPYKCGTCHASFSGKVPYNYHLRTHKTENLVQCDHCQVWLKAKQYLIRHMRIHDPRTEYTCDICQLKFTKKRALNYHLQSHSKPYKCDYCQLSMSRKFQLNRHMKTHTKSIYEATFECEKCRRRFKTIDALKKHGIIHSGEKPFKCSICEKPMTTKAGLSNHMKLHERPQHSL